MTETEQSTPHLFRDLNAWHLSALAECGSPSAIDSEGARFLHHVASATSEAILWAIEHEDMTPGEACEHVAEEAHDIADGAPDAYTFSMWQEFVDLAAWQEDISDYGTPEDLDQGARWALYVIAERLTRYLCEEAAGALEDVTS